MAEYRAYGAAAELFRCTAPEILIEGPAGTGKSRSLLEKIHAITIKIRWPAGISAPRTE